MSTASGMLVAYGRLDAFSAITERARRATVDTCTENTDAVAKLVGLLEPQERPSASIDALEFQTLLKTRCGVSVGEMDTLRRELLKGSAVGTASDLLRRITAVLSRERSALASRIAGG